MAMTTEEKLKVMQMLDALSRSEKEQFEISSNINKWQKRYDEYKNIIYDEEMILWLEKEKSRLVNALETLDVDSVKFVYTIRITNLVQSKIEENKLKLTYQDKEGNSQTNLLKLLRSDQIEAVIEELLITAKEKQRSDLIKDITLQGNRWMTLKKNSQNNLTSTQDITLEKNKIVGALYELIVTLIE